MGDSKSPGRGLRSNATSALSEPDCPESGNLESMFSKRLRGKRDKENGQTSKKTRESQASMKNVALASIRVPPPSRFLLPFAKDVGKTHGCERLGERDSSGTKTRVVMGSFIGIVARAQPQPQPWDEKLLHRRFNNSAIFLNPDDCFARMHRIVAVMILRSNVVRGSGGLSV